MTSKQDVEYIQYIRLQIFRSEMLRLHHKAIRWGSK